MENFQFIFKDKSYELREDNCIGIINDEVNPMSELDLVDLLMLLKQSEDVYFDCEYYESSCDSCRFGKAEKAKVFKFLEFHFYVLTKGGKYVLSSISKEYEAASMKQLLKKDIVDNSYLVSIIVCEHCGEYTIEIECGDF